MALIIQTKNSWKRIGNDIFYTLGNVGIGNSAPAVSLEVGDATGEEIIRASSGVNGNAILSANSFFSTGNPLTQYIVAGGNNWVTGVDNADADKYKIYRSLFSSNYFSFVLLMPLYQSR